MQKGPEKCKKILKVQKSSEKCKKIMKMQKGPENTTRLCIFNRKLKFSKTFKGL